MIILFHAIEFSSLCFTEIWFIIRRDGICKSSIWFNGVRLKSEKEWSPDHPMRRRQSLMMSRSLLLAGNIINFETIKFTIYDVTEWHQDDDDDDGAMSLLISQSWIILLLFRSGSIRWWSSDGVLLPESRRNSSDETIGKWKACHHGDVCLLPSRQTRQWGITHHILSFSLPFSLLIITCLVE